MYSVQLDVRCGELTGVEEALKVPYSHFTCSVLHELNT